MKTQLHHRCLTRPGATRRSTLDDWATRNKFHAMCFTPTSTSAVRTGAFPFFWVIEIGPQWSSGSIWVIRVDFRLSLKRYDPFFCGKYRCVHHTLSRLKFAALAIHATEVRLRRNIPTSVTLLTDLRRRGANTELLSVCQAQGKQARRIDLCGCSLQLGLKVLPIPLRTC